MGRTLLAAAVIVAAALAGVIGWRSTRHGPSEGDATRVGVPTAPQVPSPFPAPPLRPDASQGLRCIHGGTTRDEVRAIMGEPDSVAYGDWVYGRSSVTFGYGVVLDYANVGGNLIVCP